MNPSEVSEEENLHCELTFIIGKLVVGNDFKDVKRLCGKKLMEQEMEGVNDVYELMAELEKRGHIGCGDYEQISKVFKTARLPKVVKIIEEYACKIRKAAEPGTTLIESDGQFDNLNNDIMQTEVDDIGNLSEHWRKTYIEEYHAYCAGLGEEETHLAAKRVKLNNVATECKTEPLLTGDVVELLRMGENKLDEKYAEHLEQELKYRWASGKEDDRLTLSWRDLRPLVPYIPQNWAREDESLQERIDASMRDQKASMRDQKASMRDQKASMRDQKALMEKKNQKTREYVQNNEKELKFQIWLLKKKPIIILNEYKSSAEEILAFKRFIKIPEVKENCTTVYITKQHVGDKCNRP